MDHLNSVLAYSQGVPELDGVVTCTRYNLSVVSRERHTQHILSVTHKPSGGHSPKEKRERGGEIIPIGFTLVCSYKPHHL